MGNRCGVAVTAALLSAVLLDQAWIHSPHSLLRDERRWQERGGGSVLKCSLFKCKGLGLDSQPPS